MSALTIDNILFKSDLKKYAQAFCIVGMITLVGAFIGIIGRPLAFLSIFWVANAVLLGLFLRFEVLNNPGGWLGAFTAYMFADLTTGGTLLVTLCLSIANLLTPYITLILIRKFKVDYRHYNKGLTFVYLFFFSAFGGCLASALFAISTVPYLPNTFMSVERIWLDFGIWWSGELLNVICFLPVILSIPEWQTVQKFFREDIFQNINIHKFLPIMSVIISVTATHFYVGPGAIMFPIAALVWTALTYHLFTVALINCLVCMIMHYSISGHYLAGSTENYFSTTISVRLGLFMLALGPLLSLSIINRNNQSIYKQISNLANYDSLTTAMNRRYFYQESETYLNPNQTEQTAKTISILLLDLDHFKKINDTHGHTAGDKVLEKFSLSIRTQIREQDLFGRIGGEEFAILLKNVSLEESATIAERICKLTSTTPIFIDAKKELSVSVSIGISHHKLPDKINIQELVERADTALYQAKTNGRNQCCIEMDPNYQHCLL